MAQKHKYNYDYPENREVNKKLNKGDRVDIASTLEFSDDYVRKVLQGRRNNVEIIALANQIIEDRASRRKPFESKEE